jgi:ApaG protein
MSGERPLYESVTRGIRISVEPDYLEDESEPDEDHYVWAYRVRIDNDSDETVRLKNRRWHITDATGRTVIVTGDGVIGEQPSLQPGDAYEYTSGCPLPTPSGLMFGVYGMETDSGEHFEADIPAFSLDSPHDLHRLN